MFSVILKFLFGDPSSPKENTAPALINEEIVDKDAFHLRLLSDREYLAKVNPSAVSAKPTLALKHDAIDECPPITVAETVNNAPSAQSKTAVHNNLAPEQPLDQIARPSSLPSRLQNKNVNQKVDATIETANYFYEVIRKAIVDEKGLHVETAIITAARLCGSLLYRSVPADTNRKYANPGTTMLNPEVDKVGREMEGLLLTSLGGFGVHIDVSKVKKKTSQQPVKDTLAHSRLSFMETMERIQPFCLSFYEITGDYRQGAAAATITTAMLIRDAASILDVNDAVSMTVMGMVEGGKTAPPLGNTKDEKIHAEKPTDPINHFKNDGETLYYFVKDSLVLHGGFDLPSLFCALGALAGQTCLQYALAEYQLQKIPTTKEIPTNEAKLTKEKSLFAFNVKSSGQDYFFGDLLNHPLCESRYSVWNVVQFYLKQLDHQFEFDVHEVFDYVAKNIGEQKFGMLRLPMQYMPRELPIFYLKQLWPSAAEALTNISANKTDWHYILSSALLHAIHTHKQDNNKLPPALIAKIVMESAVPMSKVPLDPNIVLGNYIVNRQKIH